MHFCNCDTGLINCGNVHKSVAPLRVVFSELIVCFFSCFWFLWDLCCLPCSSFCKGCGFS